VDGLVPAGRAPEEWCVTAAATGQRSVLTGRALSVP